MKPENIELLKKFQFKDMLETLIGISNQVRVFKGLDEQCKPIENIYQSDFFDIVGENYCYSFKVTDLPDVWNKLQKVIPKVSVQVEHPKTEFTEILTLNKEQINTIKTVSKFTSDDQLRPEFQCVFIGNSEIAATDAYRVVRLSFNYSGDPLLLDKDAQKFIRSCKSYLKIYESEKKIRLESIDKSIELSKCDFIYPNYNAVIPKNNPYKITVKRESLLNAIRRAGNFSNQASQLIRFECENGVLSLRSCDIDFATGSTEKLIVNGSFDFVIGFKSVFLEQCLSVSRENEATFELSDPSRAVIIDGSVLLMPMLVNDCTYSKAA